MPRAQIKDEKTYQKLREQGSSKEKSARIANAAAATSRSKVGRKGGRSPSYDDWSKEDLLKRAREIGIKGRSSMTKPQLVKALRNH
ncbi:MAG: DUF7218 family protein [Streptosporangiaceae bacterium]